MIERKNIWTVATVIIVLVCTIVIYQLFHMPTPKAITNTYVMGTTISKQATTYFDNVTSNQTVSVKDEQFQKEGIYFIDVSLDGVTYKVKQKNEVPNIANIVKISSKRETIVVGEDYAKFFHIKEDLIDDVTFSVPSTNLTIGNTTLTISAFGQSVTQPLTVLAADSVEGKLTLSTDFSKELLDVVSQYLNQENISQDNVAMVYRNFKSNNIVTLNQTNTMLAADSVEVPIAMLAEQKVAKGELDATVVHTLIDNTIHLSSTMAERTLVNTIGGIEQVYQQLSTFGTVSGVAPTVTQISGQTTAEYFNLVLNELYTNRDNYVATSEAMKQSGKNKLISRYLGDLDVWHRPSVLGQVINDIAIVESQTPYLLVLLTRNITSQQYSELAYLINEWHKKH